MKRNILLALGLIISPLAMAQNPAPKFASQQVTDSIIMLYGAQGFTGGNIAVSIGEDGVAVIDNGLASILDKLNAELGKITKRPIDYLVNTHVHGDHIGNNAHFGANGTTLVSHRNLRTALLRDGIGSRTNKSPAPAAALPRITFNDQLTLHLNGDVLRLIHLPAAHTDGDTVIFFEKANVLHTGDIMFNGLFPFIDYSNGGSLNGVIDALQAISDLSNAQTKIIPGHGPLASKTDVDGIVAMLKDSRAMVKTLVDKGLTDEQILQKNPLSKYQSLSWGFINTERMTNQLIQGVR